MKILFISRAFPPITGGIENQNYELSVWLPKICTVKTIANKRGKLFLPIFLPYALIRVFFLIKNYDAVLLGDGVLSILGWKLKFFSKKPVICITHGLDLTYKSWLYQKLWVGFFIKKMDGLMAVGNQTISAGIERGIPREKFIFIPNGVDTEKFFEKHTREELEMFLSVKLESKKIILTTGRLAPHKGIDWFCSEVIPRLGDNILYIVAGAGEKRKNIEQIVAEKSIGHRVKILGKVSDNELKLLYNTADLYVKPNIRVEGMMEGFGLVVLEAASCKLPVIASRLEGLQDAIMDGENGFLVESENSGAWVNKINEILTDDDFLHEFGEKARKYVINNFSWEIISKKYLAEIVRIVNKK